MNEALLTAIRTLFKPGDIFEVQNKQGGDPTADNLGEKRWSKRASRKA